MSGILVLSGTDGLTGSGDGTGSLSYTGPLTALNTALEGLRFIPPHEAHVFTTMSLSAQSLGAPALQAQFTLTDGVFVVTTTADSGPGSLRQAILDTGAVSNARTTIEFEIPGQGAHTIAPASPLPTISNSVLIDGWSEPGFTGAPLIELASQSAGDFGILSIDSPSATVRGLAIPGFSHRNLDSYRIDTTTDERLMAQVQGGGTNTQLLLLDAQGNLLMQSDGQSPSNHDEAIDVHIPAGSVFLEVTTIGRTGTYTLMTMMAAANTPFQPIPAGAGQPPWWRVTGTATESPTWQSPTGTTSPCC